MITKGKVVTMEYVLKDDQGQLLEQSAGHPMNYLHGYNNIIVGLEKELEGLAQGGKKQIKVSPEEGYGTYNPELKFSVPIQNFGDQVPPEGELVGVQTPQGNFTAVSMGADKEQVFLDANHPLAGVTLVFDVEIVSVRDASAEEIQHGHVHGPGGHHH